MTVGKGNLIATVASSGLVASASQVALSFGSTGTVKQVYVKLGDQVKKGQVLAELDSTDLQFALANSQLTLNQQQIKFDLVKAGPTAADLAAAQLNVDTTRRLTIPRSARPASTTSSSSSIATAWISLR